MPAAGFTDEIRAEREGLIKKLETLLQAPGTDVSWDELAERLRKIPLRELNALWYRIDRAVSGAFDDGVKHGESDDNNTTVQPGDYQGDLG